MAGSISKRGSSYRARVYRPDGSRASKTFERRRDAQAWIRRQESSGLDDRLGRLSVAEWVAEWRDTRFGMRETSIVRQDSCLDLHILPNFGDVALADVRQLDVQRWVAHQVKQGYAPATIRKNVQAFSVLMRAAVDADMIPVSPVRRLRLPEVEPMRERILTPEEIARLAGAIHPRFRVMILVLGYCGLRIGEACALRWERVDLDAGMLTVAESVAEPRGELIIGPPKTRAGRRTIPLPAGLVGELANDRQGATKGDFVFRGAQGGVVRPKLWRRRFFAPAVRAAGLEPLRPHDLRHTAISLWVSQGIDLARIQRYAGHASVTALLDRYGHAYADDGSFAARMDALFVAS